MKQFKYTNIANYVLYISVDLSTPLPQPPRPRPPQKPYQRAF